MKSFDMSFYIDSWYAGFSTKFTTKGFIPKWMAMICLSALIVDMHVFPQNSQLKALFLNESLSTFIVDLYVFQQNSKLKALFLNEWLWYVFLQW